MKRLLLTALIPIALSFNIAFAASWCGYDKNANITTSDPRAAARLDVIAGIVTNNGCTGTVLTQLNDFKQMCTDASGAKGTSQQKNYCTAAYACLKQDVSGTPCFNLKVNNKSCAVANTGFIYKPQVGNAYLGSCEAPPAAVKAVVNAITGGTGTTTTPPVSKSAPTCTGNQALQGSICAPCGAGQVPNATNNSCSNCTGNTIPNDAGTACNACGTGLIPDSKNANCITCTTGQVPNQAGTACIPLVCTSGQVPNAAGNGCMALTCTGNTIPNAAGNACTPCTSGQVPNSANTSCSACTSGQVPNTAGTACIACTGMQVPQGNVCTNCPSGQAPNSANSSCVALSCTGNQVPQGNACVTCGSGLVADATNSNCITPPPAPTPVAAPAAPTTTTTGGIVGEITPAATPTVAQQVAAVAACNNSAIQSIVERALGTSYAETKTNVCAASAQATDSDSSIKDALAACCSKL